MKKHLLNVGFTFFSITAFISITKIQEVNNLITNNPIIALIISSVALVIIAKQINGGR